MSSNGWIGVDFDGTLVEYDGWKGADHVGAPIPLMVERVKAWLAEGRDVRIFTARVWCDPTQFDWGGARGRSEESYHAEGVIQLWCAQHFGMALPVTCMKDYGMIELWDDRSVQVVPNTGERAVEAIAKAFLKAHAQAHKSPPHPQGACGVVLNHGIAFDG